VESNLGIKVVHNFCPDQFCDVRGKVGQIPTWTDINSSLAKSSDWIGTRHCTSRSKLSSCSKSVESVACCRALNKVSETNSYRGRKVCETGMVGMVGQLTH
jgi:hypothetical protein